MELNMEEEITKLCNQICENLGIQMELDDLNNLFHEDIYIEIYELMFPHIVQQLKLIQKKQASSGVKLQELLDLLSKEILTMDLSHIQGKKKNKKK